MTELDAHEQVILCWPPTDPDPAALRCAQSRHRTLAHLRACQETWLAACLAFAEKPGARVKLPHPWRLFEQKSYATVPWDEHRAAFLADRARWKALLAATDDREIGGKLNDQAQTIASLTERLLAHERHHLSI